MSTPLTKQHVRSTLGFDTDAEIAAFFGISASAVSQWAEEDEIPELRQLQAERKRPDLFGALAFGGAVKAEAAPAIAQLQALGLHTMLLTGDHAASAQHVASSLGISQVRAAQRPQDKAETVAALRQQGYVVAMVGDGINDAPALATADVSFAMSTGTDVAMHTAAVTLMRADPRLVADTIDISRRSYRKIRQNLFWAFIYNLIGIPLAAFGLLSPIIAGAAMALSSVSVITNALLLRRWRAASGTEA